MKSNSRLMAAAPDLLRACKLAILIHDTLSSQKAVQDFAKREGFFPFFDPGQAATIRAAIEKAEGGAA